MWSFREREAGREVRALLGEPRLRRRPRLREAPSESEMEQLLRVADRMAKALVRNEEKDIKYARKLAVEFLEARAGAFQ